MRLNDVIYHASTQSEHWLFLPILWDSAHTPQLICFASTSLPAPQNPNGRGKVSGQLAQMSSLSISLARSHPSFAHAVNRPSLRASSVLRTQGGQVQAQTQQPFLFPPSIPLLSQRFAQCTQTAAVHSAPGGHRIIEGLRLGQGALLLTFPHILSCGFSISLRCRAGEGGGHREIFFFKDWIELLGTP